MTNTRTNKLPNAADEIQPAKPGTEGTGKVLARGLRAGAIMTRKLLVDVSAVNEDERSATVAFSSSSPVRRPWGDEVLSHKPGAIRTGRLEQGLSVLVEHKSEDLVGITEGYQLDTMAERGRAKIRFGRSSRAVEVMQDVADGIRPHISVGYIIHDAVEHARNGEPPLVEITDWEPIEVSIVAVPADMTVGVGRSLRTPPAGGARHRGEQSMEDRLRNAEAVTTSEADAQSIRALGDMHEARELAERAVSAGMTLEAFQNTLLDELSRRDGEPVRNTPRPQNAGAGADVLGTGQRMVHQPATSLGLSPAEAGQFSLLRAFRAMLEPNNRRAQAEAGFEFEVCAAYAKRDGVVPQGLYIGHEMLTRDLLKGAPGTGSNLVATDHLAGSFIEELRARSVIMAQGTVLSGLVGDVAIPRQLTGSAATWVDEDEAVNEQTPTFDQVQLTPRTCGAYVNLGRKMLLQSSPAAEQLVQNDLKNAIALAADQAAINGASGGAGPTGILNTTGVSAVEGGVNGASLTWAHLVELETQLAESDADVGSLAYLVNPATRGYLKTTPIVAGQPVFMWERAESSIRERLQGRGPDGLVNGCPAYTSSQVPANLTKGTSEGNCSAILFGDFSNVLVGMWRGVDITIDPNTYATKGAVRIVALQDMDIALRRPEMFAVMDDALLN